MTLSDSDLALLGAYLDGSMEDEQEVFRFEERLSQETELADALHANLRVDLFARRMAETQGERPALQRHIPRRSLAPLVFGIALATAACLLVVFLLRPEPARTCIALVPSAVSIQDYNRELGLKGADANKVPRGTLRGSDPNPAGLVEIPIEEYLSMLEPLQDRRLQDALVGSYRFVDADYFVVALRTVEPCSAIVLLVDGAGRVLDSKGNEGSIAWPADGEWTSASGRLETPGDHVLPRRNVLRGDERLYEAGFLVPVGAGHITALIAWRREPLDANLRQTLQATVDQSRGEGSQAIQRLSHWLEDNGFDVQIKVVSERVQEGR
jgi:hypothetical protein